MRDKPETETPSVASEEQDFESLVVPISSVVIKTVKSLCHNSSYNEGTLLCNIVTRLLLITFEVMPSEGRPEFFAHIIRELERNDFLPRKH